MRGLSYHQRPRSLRAQRARMASRWLEFEFEDLKDRLVSWTGPLRRPSEAIPDGGVLGPRARR